MLGYLAAGMVEFVHYFYRGLSRTDIESTLTIWHRLGTLAAACIALWRGRTLQRWPRRWSFLRSRPPCHAAARAGMGRARHRLAPRPVAAFGIRPRRGAGRRRILLSALYFRLDVFLLEAWQGTETVGLYNSVFRVVDALRLFPAALLAVMLPRLVRPANPPSARSRWRRADGVRHRGGGCTLAHRGPPGPGLYGPSFAAAVPALQSARRGFPADVAELRADAAADRVERAPCLRRAVPGGVGLQCRVERAMHPGHVVERRRVVDARD